MDGKKAVKNKLLACVCALVIGIMSVPVTAYAGDYYPIDVDDFIISTDSHYNPPGSGSNSFTLSGQILVNIPEGYHMLADKRYQIDGYFNFGNYTLSAGAKMCTISSPRIYIVVEGQKQYMDDVWFSFVVDGKNVTRFVFGLEYDFVVDAADSTYVGDTSALYTYMQQYIVDFQYRVTEIDSKEDKLLEEGNRLQEEANTLQEEANATSKNIFDKITDFFDNFFSRLGDFLLGLIVPSSEDLTAFLDEVNEWFSARLGFIWYPFSLALDIVSAFAGGTADTTFKVPGLTLNILGGEHTIWNPIEVDLDAFGIFKYVRMFTSFLLVAGVVKLAYDKWDEWIGGHGVG